MDKENEPTKTKKPFHFWRWFFAILGLCLIGFGWFAYVFFFTEMSYHITVSKETTYVTEPLNEEGRVDFLKAMNRIASEGVTPETNAAVPILEASRINFQDEADIKAFYDLIELGADGQPTTERPRLLSFYEERYPAESFSASQAAKEIEQNCGVVRPLSLEGTGLEETTSDESSEISDDPAIKLLELDRNEEYYKDRMNEGTIKDVVRRQEQHATSTPWTADQLPAVAEWLERHDTTLTAIVEGCERPGWYLPISISGTGFMDEEIASRVATCLSIRAMNRAGEGDLQAAWQDTLAMKRLVYFLEVYSEPDLCISVDRFALRAVATIVNHPDADAKLHAKITGDLAAIDRLPPRHLLANRLVRCMLLYSITRLPDQWESYDPSDDNYYARAERNILRRRINWDEVLRRTNHILDEIDALGAKATPWYSKRLEKVFDARPHDPSIMTIQPWDYLFDVRATDQFSKTLNNMLRQHMERELEELTHANVYDRMTRLVVKLAIYHQEHGEYPEQIKEIFDDDKASSILTACPMTMVYDTFYVKHPEDEIGYRLRNIGPNGRDDGGENEFFDSYRLGEIDFTAPSSGNDDIHIRVVPGRAIYKKCWDVEQYTPYDPPPESKPDDSESGSFDPFG